MNDHELKRELSQHHGSEEIFKHSLNANFNYTQGVRAFALCAGNGAYWLLDILATEPAIRQAVRDEGFCVMMLDVRSTGDFAHDQGTVEDFKRRDMARLTVSRDSKEDPSVGGATPLYTAVDVRFIRYLEYTDCPPGQWKFYLTWAEVGDANVMLAMLPSEY